MNKERILKLKSIRQGITGEMANLIALLAAELVLELRKQRRKIKARALLERAVDHKDARLVAIRVQLHAELDRLLRL
jgi:hypothetical protein